MTRLRLRLYSGGATLGSSGVRLAYLEYLDRHGSLARHLCESGRLDLDTGALTIVADDFVRPNGLAFSLDESHLFVTAGRSV